MREYSVTKFMTKFMTKNSGRWGETDPEKGPGDLFPGEPTDEGIYAEETLDLGDKGLLGINNKIRAGSKTCSHFVLRAGDGT